MPVPFRARPGALLSLARRDGRLPQGPPRPHRLPRPRQSARLHGELLHRSPMAAATPQPWTATRRGWPISAPRLIHSTPKRSVLDKQKIMGSVDVDVPRGELPAAGNAWVGSSGPAAFDLRSDTMTTPTPSMLAAIQACSLLDDVFMEDPTTMDLEAYVASLAGKEASLFVLSGTMGNQLALRSLLTQPPHGVLLDHRSHVVKYEAGGTASLSGAQIKPVAPSNGVYLTLEDVQENAILDDDVHSCPTRVISLENTLNGMIMPLDEVKKIAAFARQHGIKLHLDGARLWEAVAADAGSLVDYCSHFDTVSLCFSKGLGAPIGSILVGSAATIKHARWTRKAIGGGLRQSGVVTAPARVALDETFHGGLLKASHECAKRIEQIWVDLGGKLIHPVQTNMCWLDLKAAGCSNQRFDELGRSVGLKLRGSRLVVHYQVAQRAADVVPKLEEVFRGVFEASEPAPGGSIGEESMYKT